MALVFTKKWVSSIKPLAGAKDLVTTTATLLKFETQNLRRHTKVTLRQPFYYTMVNNTLLDTLHTVYTTQQHHAQSPLN
jgi:hypothetical protein